MKNLQFNPYQCKARRGWGGAGRVGSKMSKSIPAPPHGTGLKSHPILAPPPLWGRKNLRRAKRGETDQVEQGKIVIPRPYDTSGSAGVDK